MVGTARKNVNSAAMVREQPMIMAPRMAPERLVPGIRLEHLKRTDEQRDAVVDLVDAPHLGRCLPIVFPSK